MQIKTINRIRRFNLCKSTVFFLVSLLVINPSHSYGSDNLCSNIFVETKVLDKYSGLFKPDSSGNFHWVGFTPKAKALLVKEATNVRLMLRQVKTIILDLDTILDSYFLAKIGRFHIINTGQHGAAKTFSAKLTSPNLRILTVTEWTSPLAVTGGQTLSGAEAGRAEINVDESLVNHGDVLIDEFDKSNPSFAGALLEVMSDRSVNGHPIRLRSLIINSNDTQASLLIRWGREGRDKTALAFFNRALFKNYFTNWANQNIRRQMLALQNKTDRANSLALDDEGARAWLKQNKTPEIDYELLERAALSGFIKYDESLEQAVHDFADMLKESLVEAVNKSVRENRDNPDSVPIVFTPAADLTNRLATQLIKLVQISAFLDFINSPLAESLNLDSMLEKPIELGPSSLWRLFRVATTTMPGKTMFNPETGEVLFAGELSNTGEIHPRNWSALIKLQTSNIDRIEIEQKKLEMHIFLDNLYRLWGNIKGATTRVASIMAAHSNINNEFQLDSQDFEMILWNANGRPTWVGHDESMPSPDGYSTETDKP